MAQWNSTPSWTPPSSINNGEEFSSVSEITPYVFNKLVNNMQYLYKTGVIDDMNVYSQVGAIYVSTNATSPASLFGGTWTRITDKILVGSGSSFTAGSSGGKISHDHSLSSGYAKFLTRRSGFSYASETTTESWTPQYYASDATQYSNFTNNYVVNTATELGGKTVKEDNMPPYLSVYIWQRTA